MLSMEDKNLMVVRRDIRQTIAERGIDESAYQLLLDYGRRRQSITRGQVIDVIPDTEFDGPLIEEFIQAINEEGIEVVEESDEIDEDQDFTIDDEVTTSTNDVDVADIVTEDINLAGVEVDDVLRIYLKEAAQVPLLTASEEVELARRIELCRMAYEELANGEEISAKRREELMQIIDIGRAARERMIRSNTRLVVSVAKRYVGRGLPLTDLIQEGNIGLMRAIRNYDYHRGFKFSTYATWWIRQAVSRALADQGRTIRLPAYISDQITRIRRVQLQLQQQLGRTPSYEELGEALGMPAARVEQIFGSMAQPASLEAPIGEENDAELGDVLQDVNTPSPEDAVLDSMDNEDVRRRLNILPEREKELIELRFGLGEEEAMTLAEVGNRLGITRERARQLEAQALERLRDPVAASRRKRRGPAPKGTNKG
jgi:RNA polymerase primary sigma factor